MPGQGLAEPPLVGSLVQYLRAGAELPARAARLAECRIAVALAWHAIGLTEVERAALREASLFQLRETMDAEAMAERVSEVLASHGVAHVFFKGPVTAAGWDRTWASRESRTYADLDVLVSPHDREAAISALCEDLGAHRARSSFGQITLLSHRTWIDLHWELLNDERRALEHDFATTKVFEANVVWSAAQGRLDPEMALLHTLAHATMSELVRPVSLVDIDAGSRSVQDWGQFQRYAKAHRLGLVARVGLVASQRWMSSPLPDGLIGELAPRGPWAHGCEFALKRPPHRHLERGWSGDELYRHTRVNDVSSIVDLLRGVPLQVRTQRDLRTGRTP